MATQAEVQAYISMWESYRASTTPTTARYDQLRQDLYKVRNGKGTYPIYLIHSDPEVMAAAEHYFLSRAWVGNGTYPAWQLRTMTWLYNTGKELGVTPQHNPNNPTTPPSAVQRHFQSQGVTDGEADLAAAGGSAPLVASPPTYW
ncbi:hypothetical protein [Vannielia litorea]|uniref:Uncharacterized protein n=1 Tax=Vannielia litorea TaxID=1217970 RepID=A0A1N6F599_9RHOB|nr:hypothetical protein [Vannielia litorea]SIN90435.1 hypothetical protein SAMN05444002_1385 [Vannielia litorea]